MKEIIKFEELIQCRLYHSHIPTYVVYGKLKEGGIS